VSDVIPHGDLPQLTSSVLELVPQVAHIDVHSVVVEQLSQESREVVAGCSQSFQCDCYAFIPNSAI